MAADSIVVGTAGHIDHGKSALVQALTGIDPDRLEEEKTRGITIELGFAHTVLGGTTVAFVDVPGHERFVRTMLAGVGGVDAVMLVVAADESVMPQTREHFDICRLLRVARGLVALTKVDLADRDTLEIVRLEVQELVAGSFLEQAPVVPVSAVTGEGLDALRDALVACARSVERRTEAGAARLPIDRVFSIRGFGTVVTGTVVSGAIEPDQELELLPGGRLVKVRGIQVHGRSALRVGAGQRAAVNLAGIEVAEIARGQTLAAPGSRLATRRADAVLELLPGATPLRHGARIRVHQGTAEVLGRVSLAGADVAVVEPGGEALVRLRLESPAVLTRGDRFIVRTYSPPVTIGGGQILDPDPPRSGVRSTAAAARLASLVVPATSEDLGDLTAAARMVRDAGSSGLPRQALVARAGLPPGRLVDAVGALVARGSVVVAGERLVAPDVVDALARRVRTLLADHHRTQPLSEGMPREEVRGRACGRGDPAVFELALARLAAAGEVGGRDRLALASHRVALSSEEEGALEAVERVYRDAGLMPPDAGAAAAAAGVPETLAERVRSVLLRRRQLVRLDTLLFHREALARLKADVVALREQAGGREVRLDVGMFKDRYGITRKYAIPLLEYLDRERVTRRVGDIRIVL